MAVEISPSNCLLYNPKRQIRDFRILLLTDRCSHLFDHVSIATFISFRYNVLAHIFDTTKQLAFNLIQAIMDHANFRPEALHSIIGNELALVSINESRLGTHRE